MIVVEPKSNRISRIMNCGCVNIYVCEHNTGMIPNWEWLVKVCITWPLRACKYIKMVAHRHMLHKLCVYRILSIMYMLRVFTRIENRIIKCWVLIEMIKYKFQLIPSTRLWWILMSLNLKVIKWVNFTFDSITHCDCMCIDY